MIPLISLWIFRMQLKIVERGQTNAFVSFERWIFRDAWIHGWIFVIFTLQRFWSGRLMRHERRKSRRGRSRRDSRRSFGVSRRETGGNPFVCHVFRSARPDLEIAFQFPHLTAMRVRIIFVRQFLFNILFNSSLYDWYVTLSCRQLGNTIMRHFNYPTDRFMVSSQKQKWPKEIVELEKLKQCSFYFK